MATTSTETEAGAATEPDHTYPGKIFLFIQDPKTLLAAGYDELRVYRQKDKTKPRKEITKVGKTRICIMEGVYNYYFIDDEAEIGFIYEVDLASSTSDDPT